MVDDVGDLDAAHMSAAVDIDIFRNTYSGLYKFDDQLNEVPDIASGPPTISTDGMTYTFKLKQNVKFSNGDAVKADDFIFSWDRAAAIQGDYASVFQPVQGYDDVSNGKAAHMTGLKKIDDFSFSATLTAPAGYWYTETALWTTWIGFNMCEGAGKPSKNCTGSNPFAGDAGKVGREAFSLAVDRDQLVDIACSKGTTCLKATGGVITKGLKGYLGDNTDPWAVFDKAKAQSLYKQWDPDGSKVKNLVYTYNTTAFTKAMR